MWTGIENEMLSKTYNFAYVVYKRDTNPIEYYEQLTPTKYRIQNTQFSIMHVLI